MVILHESKQKMAVTINITALRDVMLLMIASHPTKQ
jgi:hypothetical protein